MPRLYKVMIADRSELIREGIKSFLTEHDGFEISGEAENFKELESLLSEQNADVVVMDYDVPGSFSLKNLVQLKSNYPELGILVVTANKNKSEVTKVLKTGVNNYILKLCDKDEFHTALKATIRNERFICGKVLDALLDTQEKTGVTCSGVVLTQRETEIVQLIAQGKTNADIAATLFLSVHTIGTHRKNILKKLGINKSSELVLYAVRNGIISENDINI